MNYLFYKKLKMLLTATTLGLSFMALSTLAYAHGEKEHSAGHGHHHEGAAHHHVQNHEDVHRNVNVEGGGVVEPVVPVAPVVVPTETLPHNPPPK